MLSHDFSGLFRGLKLDLAVPTYQKYISMLSHDSGDIKNVENELITKKIQAFELRRIYIFSISFSITLFAAKLSLRDTTFSAVFLHDRINLSPSRSFMKSRSSNKLFKSIGRSSNRLITNKLRPHLYTR